MAVAEEFRGKGIGRALLSNVLNTVKAKEFNLKCRSGNVSFYKKLGFTEVGYEKGYYKEREFNGHLYPAEDAVLMRLKNTAGFQVVGLL